MLGDERPPSLGPWRDISGPSGAVKLDRPGLSLLRLDSSSVPPPPWIYGFICTANQTFASAVFQMFETRSSRLWPRSDASKLGSDPPVFSWLSWMSESGEDSTAVWPGAADSSIWDPSINKEHRPVRRPANGPRRALSQQHLDTDGTHAHTHIIHM